VKIAEHKAEPYVEMWKIKDWTLWRGDPLQNEKKTAKTPAPNR
jgi:hypothetical protein